MDLRDWRASIVAKLWPHSHAQRDDVGWSGFRKGSPRLHEASTTTLMVCLPSGKSKVEVIITIRPITRHNKAPPSRIKDTPAAAGGTFLFFFMLFH
jgi:hypothetical protein